jgi:hypothetical protein
MHAAHHPTMPSRSTTSNASYQPSQLAPQPTGYHGVGPMRATPTGAAWDDGLPRPLSIARRNFEDRQSSPSPLGRSASQRDQGSRSRSNLGSANSSQQNLPSSNGTSPMLSQREVSATTGSKDESNVNNPFEAGNRFDSRSQQSPLQPTFQADATNVNNPFERVNRFDQPASMQQYRTQSQGATGFSTQLPQQSNINNPFESGNRFDQPRMSVPQAVPSSNNPFEAYGGAQQPMAPIAEGKTPAGEKDMSEWWR